MVALDDTIPMLEPDLQRLVASNPSPMTGQGTNTYILGQKECVVIDPGPDDPGHLGAILQGLDQRPLRHILVTHAHLDHSPLARALSTATGAKVLAFGDSRAGRSAQMQALAEQGIGGGEGVDAEFRPDSTLADGAELTLEGDILRAFWTPGHFGNHMCFAWRGAVFSGDHVMGWASSLISPPDGDMGAYMHALARLEGLGARRFYPGHGEAVDNPAARIAELRAHRKAREAAILGCLAAGADHIGQIVAKLYRDTPPALHPAAARNVFAHLLDLGARGRVAGHPALHPESRFRLV